MIWRKLSVKSSKKYTREKIKLLNGGKLERKNKKIL